MNTKLLKYFKDKLVKCWYPSSGLDFEAIKLFEGLSHTPCPNLYIFTDIAFSAMRKEDILNLNKLHGFELIENFELDDLLTWLPKFDSNNPDQQSRLKEHFMKEKRLSDPESIELMEMGVVGLGDVDEDYFNTLDYKTKKYIIWGESSITVQVYKREETILLLISSTNESFYNFCIHQQIKINGTIIIRANDEQFLLPNLQQILDELQIKNGFFYMHHVNRFLLQNQIGETFQKQHNDYLDDIIFSKW